MRRGLEAAAAARLFNIVDSPETSDDLERRWKHFFYGWELAPLPKYTSIHLSSSMHREGAIQEYLQGG